MNKQLWVLRAMYFGYYAQQAILLPYLPLYFADKGFDSVQIGLLINIGTFAAVFTQPVWGFASDRFQTIKKIVAILWGASLLTSIGLFTAGSFSTSFLYAVLLYLFLIPSAPLLDALAIKNAEESGTPYGSFRLWGSIGFTVTALSAGVVFKWIGGVENMGYAYWGIWIIPLSMLLLLKDQKAAQKGRVTLTSLKSVVKNRPLLWFLFLVFILMIPHRMHDSLFGIYLQDLDVSDQMIGIAWAIASCSEIPTFALLSRYIHRYHELSLLFIVSILYTIRWVLTGWIEDPFILILLQAMHSITFAIFWIVAVQYAVRLVPEELRSTGQTLLSAVFMGFAGITGGIVGGMLNDQWGGQGMYVFAVIMTVVSTLLLLATHLKRRAA